MSTPHLLTAIDQLRLQLQLQLQLQPHLSAQSVGLLVMTLTLIWEHFGRLYAVRRPSTAISWAADWLGWGFAKIGSGIAYLSSFYTYLTFLDLLVTVQDLLIPIWWWATFPP